MGKHERSQFPTVGALAAGWRLIAGFLISRYNSPTNKSIMFTRPRIVAVSGELHLVAIDENGRVCLRIRHSDENGSLEDWGRLPESGFQEIDIAGVGKDLHVVGQTEEGFIKHNIRRSNGNWQGWFDIPGDSLLDPFNDTTN